MQLGKVLFATDYSSTGDLAFSLAASIAGHAEAELLLVPSRNSPTNSVWI